MCVCVCVCVCACVHVFCSGKNMRSTNCHKLPSYGAPYKTTVLANLSIVQCSLSLAELAPEVVHLQLCRTTVLTGHHLLTNSCNTCLLDNVCVWGGGGGGGLGVHACVCAWCACVCCVCVRMCMLCVYVVCVCCVCACGGRST